MSLQRFTCNVSGVLLGAVLLRLLQIEHWNSRAGGLDLAKSPWFRTARSGEITKRRLGQVLRAVPEPISFNYWNIDDWNIDYCNIDYWNIDDWKVDYWKIVYNSNNNNSNNETPASFLCLFYLQAFSSAVL